MDTLDFHSRNMQSVQFEKKIQIPLVIPAVSKVMNFKEYTFRSGCDVAACDASGTHNTCFARTISTGRSAM